jgi:hypothetical protein
MLTWGHYRTGDLADLEGWNLTDLVASQVYGSLQRRKTLLLERIGRDGKWGVTAAHVRLTNVVVLSLHLYDAVACCTGILARPVRRVLHPI